MTGTRGLPVYNSGMLTRLIDKRLAGLADSCSIPDKRIKMLNSVSRIRLNNPSAAEKKMLFHLNCLTRICKGGIRYRREVPVHLADTIGRVVDIRFKQQRLVLEFDGSQHSKGISPEWDAWRDQLLKENGVLVLRIPNETIFKDIGNAMLLIVEALIAGGHMSDGTRSTLRNIAITLRRDTSQWGNFVGNQIALEKY